MRRLESSTPMSFQRARRKTVRSAHDIGMLVRQPGNSNTFSFEGNLSKHTNERTISYPGTGSYAFQLIDSIRLKTPVGVDDTQQRPKMDGRKEKTRQRPATQTEAPLTKRRSGDWPSTSVALPGTDIQRRLLACTLVHGTVAIFWGRGKMEGVKT